MVGQAELSACYGHSKSLQVGMQVATVGARVSCALLANIPQDTLIAHGQV